jgi:mono/diheme cytochrome c family protein
MALGLLLCLTGCGSNLEEVLFQTVTAAGRTYLDQLLTDIANELAGDREDETDDDAGGEDDDDEDEDDGDDTDDDHGDDDGDDGGPALDGVALFAANCSACHGEDGASGFAPDITGKTAAELSAALELPTHAAISLSEEEIAAIVEFLGGTTTDGGLTGDAATGEMFYTGSACGACHCPDATGGCALDAPPLVGAELATLDDFLVGDSVHAGGKFDLTEQDLADLQAYLASLD